MRKIAKESNMLDLRKVELLKDGEWIEIEFYELKEDDIFRMFESTGEEVYNNNGENILVALSDAFVGENGILTIRIL